MKTCLLLYFLVATNSFIILMFIMNVYLIEISSVPMIQLISVIIYMSWNSVSFHSCKPSMTVHIFMLLIITASGMMIILSYFVSLSNMTWIKFMNLKFHHLLVNLILWIVMIAFLMINFNIVFSMFEYKSDNLVHLIYNLFNFPNYYVFLLTIAYMFLMLILSSKMCFVKKKSLRGKLL